MKLLAFFTGASITASIFMICYFLFIRDENKSRNFLLSGIFLMISIRVVKSSYFFLTKDVSLSSIGFGFFGLSMIGPLSYFYFKGSCNENYKYRLTKMWPHFLFPVIGLSVFVSKSTYPKLEFYWIATLILSLYLTSSAYTMIIRNKKKIPTDASLYRYNIGLLIGLILIWMVFVFQHVFKSQKAYVSGIVMATFLLYLLFFFTLGSKIRITKNFKVRITDDLKNLIKEQLERKRIYKNPDINLIDFSKAIDQPSYIVSKAINLYYGHSFPKTVNMFRIEEVKQRLSQGNNLKIEILAYDAGFNSLSSFYTSFKRETGMTPGEYQKKSLGNG